MNTTPTERERMRAYYVENADRLKARRRARHAENAATENDVSRRWREGHAEERREYMRRWREANREHVLAYARANSGKYASRRKAATRRYQLKYHYDLTPDQFRDMLVGQAGRCLICGLVPEKTLVVDHDHESGRIRGLLCNPCNRLLGIAREDVRRLQSAIRYLEVAA